MTGLVSFLQLVVHALMANIVTLLGLIGVAWLVQIMNVLLDYRLNQWGIGPRRAAGLVGVVCAPWLHGNWGHLIVNSIMFFILATCVVLQGSVVFIGVSVWIVVLSGLLIWIFGRGQIHIGASALVMGYWGFLLMMAYHQPSVLNILLALICLYYFGGLFVNLFPTDAKVSWEGHVFGFISGIAASYGYPWVVHGLRAAGVMA